jgi:hypothetical protein
MADAAGSLARMDGVLHLNDEIIFKAGHQNTYSHIPRFASDNLELAYG